MFKIWFTLNYLTESFAKKLQRKTNYNAFHNLGKLHWFNKYFLMYPNVKLKT